MLSISTSATRAKPESWTLRVRDAGNDVPPADLFFPTTDRAMYAAADCLCLQPNKTAPLRTRLNG
jgi:hypothetical protein